MKIVLPLVAVALTCGCVAPKAPPAISQTQPESESPSGFYVDPAFSGGEAVMALMRKLYPSSKYISLSRLRLTEDSAYDYAEFFVGWGIEGESEGVYYRHYIFAKKKSDDWFQARAFDKGALGYKPFYGPIELLEEKGWENGRPKPNQMPVPMATSGRGTS